MALAEARTRSVQRYSTTAIVLHWVVAALILAAIVAGLVAAAKGDDPSARPIIDLHKSFGLTVLGFVVLRLLWRWTNVPPPMPSSYALWERKAAHAAHWALYALMLLLPLTGYIHDSAFKQAAAHPLTLYGLVHVPRLAYVKTLDPATKEAVHSAFFAAHVWLGYALYGLLGLHLAGVVKHQALDHEPELQRMLPETDRRP